MLEFHQLSKKYGRIEALKQVSFSVPKGTVFGILGPNGSGKTTLLGILMDVLKANAGSCTLNGNPVGPAERRKMGAFLETPNFYHYLSAEENLRIAAEIKQRGSQDIERVLHQVGLHARKDTPFSTYSLGMKQRLAIASALLGDPEILVLDEPTNGLDPVGIAEIRELILQLASTGKTILLASHLLDEVERVCDHVAILKYGTLIASGSVNSILPSGDIIELASENKDLLSKILSDFPGMVHLEAEGDFLLMQLATEENDLAVINRFCFERNIILSRLALRKKSLEKTFLELTHQS
jgi:ABC-2 type transport system ATP-binding protein